MTSSQIAPDFILVAQGNVVTPKLDIALFGDAKIAERDAEKIVAQLSLAGYFNFHLYDVTAEHVLVASYRVEQPAPVVTRE